MFKLNLESILIGIQNLIQAASQFNWEDNPILFRLSQEGYFFLIILFLGFAVNLLIAHIVSFVLTRLVKFITLFI